ncbi:MAG: EI24 domain-containing protein [Deltaproteobacteria bacterium]|nr:EI24 domain-containing protein [Deltaproteobacteria bacterium]
MTTYATSKPGTGVPGFLRGLTYPLRGIRWLLANRAVWPYALMPALVNGTIVLILAGIAYTQFDVFFAWVQPDFLEAADADLPWWKTFYKPIANVLIGLVVGVLMFVMSILGGLLSGAVLAGPFHEKLSEVVESVATGEAPPDEAFNLSTLSRDAVRAVMSAVQRLSLFGVFYVPLMLLSLIPVVGLVGVAGTLTYSAFFMALNFSDPALERRKINLRQKLRWARHSIAPWMGFGAGLMLLMLIPLLGLVLAPAFVTAGTLLWLDVGVPADLSSEQT